MPTFRLPFRAMACYCEVVLEAPDRTQALALAKAGVDEVLRIEHKYSRYRADSALARINAGAGGDWLDCDAETATLLDIAAKLHAASDGLFDITSGVLRRAWDFKCARLPAPDVLADALALVGWHKLERRTGQLRLAQAGMEIDFGGFGKEYAADRAAASIAAAGVRHGYVNLAGDVRAIGPRQDGQPWMIGIQDPRQSQGVVATIALHGGALATSGDYERYFEHEGKRYCHVLDARSGQPVRHWRSVTVQAGAAIDAGACCTIAMLKQEQALPFLDATGFNYLAVDQDGVTHKTTINKQAGQRPQGD
jgi:FAD:protein FMN transferase